MKTNNAAKAAGPRTDPRQVTFYPAWQVVLSRRQPNPAVYDPAMLGPSDPLPSKRLLRQTFHEARKAGAEFVYLRTGRGFETLDETTSQVRYLGYRNVTEYLADVCILALETVGPGNRVLRPVLDVGTLAASDLQGLAEVVDHFRYEVAFPSLPTAASAGTSRRSHDSLPEIAGQLKQLRSVDVPIVAGVYIGLGESSRMISHALQLLADFASEGGHLRAVAIHPLMVYPGMEETPYTMTSADDALAAVETARQILPGKVKVWLQSEGRRDILRQLGRSQVESIGFLCLNESLPSGQTIAAWFETEIGPVSSYRCRKVLEETSGGKQNGTERPYKSLTSDGTIHHEGIVWRPSNATGNARPRKEAAPSLS